MKKKNVKFLVINKVSVSDMSKLSGGRPLYTDGCTDPGLCNELSITCLTGNFTNCKSWECYTKQPCQVGIE